LPLKGEHLIHFAESQETDASTPETKEQKRQEGRAEDA
jgi:hypothetical protein